jgi:hypothetical protein
VMNRDMDLEMAMRESHEDGINVAIEGLENDSSDVNNGDSPDDSDYDHPPDSGEDS